MVPTRLHNPPRDLDARELDRDLAAEETAIEEERASLRAARG